MSEQVARTSAGVELVLQDTKHDAQICPMCGVVLVLDACGLCSYIAPVRKERQG